MPQMAGSFAEPRLPKTHKYMKYKGVKFYIKINISANTYDLQKPYKKPAKFGFFSRPYVKISTRNIVFCLAPYAWLESCACHIFLAIGYQGHSLSDSAMSFRFCLHTIIFLSLIYKIQKNVYYLPIKLCVETKSKIKCDKKSCCFT